MSTKTRATAAKHAAYNRGYHDGINGRPCNTDGLSPDLTIYYLAGHDEAYPKRLVPTFIPTSSGPVRTMVSLEHASFLLNSRNRTMPGGRR